LLLTVAITRGEAASSSEYVEYRSVFGGKPAFSPEFYVKTLSERTAILHGIIEKLVINEPVAIISDEWERFGRAFFAVLASPPNCLVLLKVVAPHELSMTGVAVKNLVIGVVDEFHIPHENIVAGVTDCAPVMKVGMREAGFIAVSCCAHVAVKSLEYALKCAEVSDISKIAVKADALHHNHRFAEVLQRDCSELGIKNMKTFSPSRWDDITLVTKALVRIQPAIRRFRRFSKHARS
jgi:hypothetical protein